MQIHSRRGFKPGEADGRPPADTVKNNNQPTMLAERGMQRAMNGRERAVGWGELRNKAQLMKMVGRHGDEDDYPPSFKT